MNAMVGTWAPLLLDDHVSALCRMRVSSLPDVPVQHNAAPDACPQRPEHQAADPLCPPEPRFAESGRIGVILQHDRKLESFVDQLADRKVLPPWQVERVKDDSGGNIHGPRSCDSDADNLVAGITVSDDAIDHSVQMSQAFIATSVELNREGRICEDRSVLANHTRLNAGAADVDSSIAREIIHEWVSDGAKRGGLRGVFYPRPTNKSNGSSGDE